MVNFDSKFALVVFTFFVFPASVGRFIYWLLPRLRGNKKLIFIILILSAVSIFLSPIFAYFMAFNGVSEFIYSIILGIICVMLVGSMMDRRIIYALLNDLAQYEILYNPKDASSIHKKSMQALKVKLISVFIIIFNYGGIVSLSAMYLCVILKLDVEIPLNALAIFGIMLFIYMSVLRILIKCENCGLNLFEFYKREFVKVALNIIFNKYFICMNCHAKYSLNTDVSLDNFENNYQDHYIKKTND